MFVGKEQNAGCEACGGAPLGPPGVWLCPDVQLGGPGPASPHGMGGV